MNESGPSLAVVKVLKQDADPRRVVGLVDQSARVRAIAHRHIVSPEMVLSIDGHLGIVSPYIDGVDLLDWIEVLRENSVSLPPRVLCEVLRGVAVALDAALNRIPWGETQPFAQLHRDLKPSNIMIDRDGELKVLDFGTGASQITAQSGQVHKSAYLSPERRTGRPATHASDVYALGVLGLELMSNCWLRSTPATNPRHDLKLGQIARGAHCPMRSAADEQTLRSLLLRMSAFSPASRPTASVAAQTLRRLADRAPGPSLESFAHEHATPWLNPAPQTPDTALMVQAIPLSVNVAGEQPRWPELEDDEDTNTLQPGDLGKMLEQDSSQVFLKYSGEWDTLDDTESISSLTATALFERRQARELETTQTSPTLPTISAIDVDFYDDAPTEEALTSCRIGRAREAAPPPVAFLSTGPWLTATTFAWFSVLVIAPLACLVGLLLGLLFAVALWVL